MNKVMDIARYIINYSNEKEYSISNLKLQKLLYFVQAYFLAFTQSHEPCFNERIEAWDFGPVVPSVYREFKQFGSSTIPPVKSYLECSTDNIWSVQKKLFSDDVIDQKNREIIGEIVDKFASYSAGELVDLTHNQKPWKSAYQPFLNREITKKSIKEYFGGNE